MPMVVNGLPAHVLIVHFVVVLVPATALLLIPSVLWPAARERIGVFGPLLAGITMVFALVAAEAGEWLKHKLNAEDETINQHANYGSILQYVTIAVFGLFLGWWIVAASGGQRILGKLGPLESVGKHKVVQLAVAVGAVAVALGSVYLVVMAGDTGAQATWSGYKDLLSK
ncbi:MAG: hypothetical protein LLG14_04480 [Nocardiaceae bacterium]|nr:hypothetical protein [Nocardiaceae bacterium]